MTETNNTSTVVIMPQAEVYRGIQIHHDKRGYWFIDSHGKPQQSATIEGIHCQIDIVHMVLDTVRVSRCKP